MKEGDRVDIDQDPLTRRKPEGQAALVERVVDNAGIVSG